MSVKNADLLKAKEQLKDVMAMPAFRDGVISPQVDSCGVVMKMADGTEKQLPTETLGWDYKTLPGIKMQVFSKGMKDKDVLVCIAMEDTVIPKHKAREQETIYLLHGVAIEQVTGKVVAEQTKFTIMSGVEREFFFKKGSMFTVTFVPKIKRNKK